MGLAGIETSVPMFLAQAYHNRGLSLQKIALMTATIPARTFGLYPRKGAIAVGFDADIALYDINISWTVKGADFHGLAKWSAFEGMTCDARVERTLVRGKTVYDRKASSQPQPGWGQFIARRK